MPGPNMVRQDFFNNYQQGLANVLKLMSPVSALFTGNEVQVDDKSPAIMVPDILVDDRITDVQLGRIGASLHEGTAYDTEYRNGMPGLYWRRYTMSRHRSFSWVVFDDQTKMATKIPNLPDQYVARKMATTVLRDHDKYLMLAMACGRMTGKLVARTAKDTPTPNNSDAYRIACTGDIRDYKWLPEPGEYHDNEIQPSFASITGMFLDPDNPLNTLDHLSLLFSDNWFDTNFGNNERVLIITSALEQVFINALIDKGAGTESAFKLMKDGDLSGANGPGYLGTLKGSWSLYKVHPEFLPQVYTKSASDLTIDPTGESSSKVHRQVIGFAIYKNAVQAFDFPSERLEEDGGARFKGKVYSQSFRYDLWVIEQLSEGIVPLFKPTTGNLYAAVDESFQRVANMVKAAREATNPNDSTYPMNPVTMPQTRPGHYNYPFDGVNTFLDTSLPDQSYGAIDFRYPQIDTDVDHEDAQDAAIDKKQDK